MTSQLEKSGRPDRRQAILDAAWQLVADRGYHSVRVADIARACGTSSGTVHYYFPEKDDVLRAALSHCVDEAFIRQGDTLRSIDNAHKRMLALIEMQLPASVRVRQEWSIWLQFWNEASLSPDLRAIHNDFYSRWIDAVAKIVKRGQRQGIYRDLDVNVFALLLTSATDGAAIKILTGVPNFTVETMRELLIGIVKSQLLIPVGSRA